MHRLASHSVLGNEGLNILCLDQRTKDCLQSARNDKFGIINVHSTFPLELKLNSS